MPQAYNVSSQLEERLKGRRAALNALRDLPEVYHLFYTPNLRKEALGDDMAEPVMDYILAHREKGLLGVVVRGGEIVEEPNGLVSQYQPLAQLYKIIDPVKPAENMLKTLLASCHPEAQRLYPCGVAVLFPDAQRHEFSRPRTCYIFSSEIAEPSFSDRLDALFLKPESEEDRTRFKEKFGILCNFLREHSDNAAVFEQRRDRLRMITHHSNRATPPAGQGRMRMKVSQQGMLPPSPHQPIALSKDVPSPMPSLAARIAQSKSPQIVTPELPPPARIRQVVADALQVEKPSAILKAENSQPPLVLPVAARTPASSPPRPVEPVQEDMFGILQELKERGEGDVYLTPVQWGVVICAAVAVICGMYFLSQRLSGLL